MQRRRFVQALLVGASLSSGSPVFAEDAPIIGAPKILDALRSKDIVLDSQAPAAPTASQRAPASRGAIIALQVQFTFGSAELLPHGKRQLDELAMALSDRSLASAAFELAGHTDAVGDAVSNLRLSLERADAVKQYLVQAHGLNPARLQTIGHGFNRLADPARPQAAINRRVVVRRLPGPVRTEEAGQARPLPATGGRLVPTPPQ